MRKTIGRVSLVIIGIIIILMLIFVFRLGNGALGFLQVNRTTTPVRELFFLQPDSFSDGVLKIVIFEKSAECTDPGESYLIKYMILNTSSSTVKITKSPTLGYNHASFYGNIVPIYFNEMKELLFTDSTMLNPGFEVPEKPEDYIEILPGDSFTGQVSIEFPVGLIKEKDMSTSKKPDYTLPGKGKYFVKLLFREFSSESEPAWSGVITSGLEEICAN